MWPYTERIEQQASDGKRVLSNPFYMAGCDLDYPTEAIQKAVRLAVEDHGYTWTVHPPPQNPTPNDQGWTEISW